MSDKFRNRLVIAAVIVGLAVAVADAIIHRNDPPVTICVANCS